MKIDELRMQIDALDSELTELLKMRLNIVEGIVQYKKENGLPIYDKAREESLLKRISERAGEEYCVEAVALFNKIMNVSRAYQVKKSGVRHPYAKKLKNAPIKNALPDNAAVALCEQSAQDMCESLLLVPGILRFTSVEGVFDALDNGLCAYGVIRVDSGVEEIYERLIGSKLCIVKAVRYNAQRFFILAKELQIIGNVNKTSVLVDFWGDIFESLSAVHSFGLKISAVESFFVGGKTLMYMEIESTEENSDNLLFALEMIRLESNGVWCLGTFNEEKI